MLILGRADVEELLDIDRLVDAMAAALVELSAGRAEAPARHAISVDVPGGRDGLLLAMPAFVPAAGALTTKLVTLFPANRHRPTHQAVICCFDPTNGTPVAMLDGEAITAARTAAVSALATRLLARSAAEVVAVIGAGAQAQAHVRALSRLGSSYRFLVAARDPGRAAALAGRMAVELEDAGAAPAHTVEAMASIEDAVRAADVVCLATHAGEPVIRREWLAAGAHVNSVGFNSADGGEVDQATVADATVVVESRAAAFAAPPVGAVELRLAVENGRLDPAAVAELGELAVDGDVVPNDAVANRPDRERLTLYKSVGVAVEDAAAAAMVLAAARPRGLGVEVPW